MSDAPKAPSNCPVNIFLDTCILDAHHYHFGSAQLAELAKVAKEKKLTLLLPATRCSRSRGLSG